MGLTSKPDEKIAAVLSRSSSSFPSSRVKRARDIANGTQQLRERPGTRRHRLRHGGRRDPIEMEGVSGRWLGSASRRPDDPRRPLQGDASQPKVLSRARATRPRLVSMLFWSEYRLASPGVVAGSKVKGAISGPDERFEKGRARGAQVSRRQWQGRRDRRVGRCASHVGLSRGDGDERRRPAGCGGGALRGLRFDRQGIVRPATDFPAQGRELYRLVQPGSCAQSVADYLCRRDSFAALHRRFG